MGIRSFLAPVRGCEGINGGEVVKVRLRFLGRAQRYINSENVRHLDRKIIVPPFNNADSAMPKKILFLSPNNLGR